MHGELAEEFENLGRWQDAIHHSLEAENWPTAATLLNRHKQSLLDSSAQAVKEAIEQLPRDQIDLGLVHMKAEALVRLGKIEIRRRLLHRGSFGFSQDSAGESDGKAPPPCRE